MISVLGATGYTGGLIVHELRRRGLPVLAAARNADKLRRLADDAGGVATVQVDVGDRAGLERLAARSRVLINTVGPFIDYGEPVVRAAIAHGASTMTRDLDLAAPMTAENLARLLDALRPLHPRHVLRPDLGELVDPPERLAVEAELRAIRDVLRGPQ